MGGKTGDMAQVASESEKQEHCDPNDPAACKERLKQTAREIDPLRPLRQHPFMAVAAAAAVGIIAGSPGTASTIHSVFSASLTRSLMKVVNWQIARHKAGPSPSDPPPTV